MKENLRINRLPVPTWNRLQVNDASVEWDSEEAAQKEERIAAASGEDKKFHLTITDQGDYSSKKVTVRAEKNSSITIYEVCRAARPLRAELLLEALEGADITLYQLLTPLTRTKLLHRVSGSCGENSQTRLVAVTQLSNVLGREYPIRQIAEMAHRKNAVVVVDGAQSAPHVPVDVAALGADFFAFSGHKLYGPMGIGVLYGKQELLEEMPPFLTGGEMIGSVTRQDAVYADLPHKFEAGTVNAAGAAGLKAAISYLQGVGFETIRQREQQLTEYTMDRMKEMPGIHILGSENAAEHHGIITFLVDQVHPHDVSEILASDGIAVRAGHHCAQPLLNHLGYRSTTRVSFAFYNTREDADCFLESLQTIRERMGYGK